MEVVRENKLKFKNLKLGKPDLIRSLEEMKDVLYDQKWLKTAKNFQVYYVWRGVDPKTSPLGDLKGKDKKELRYDITIIPPKMMGGEFPKTKGHKHLGKSSELIYVLEGEAFYLSQWGKNDKINKIEAVLAKKGDWIVYAPHSEHLTINPGKKRLVMANWLSYKVKSDYSLFEKYQGAGYYYLKSGWVKNKNYKKLAKLRFKKPDEKPPKNLNFLYA